jgi:nitrate reductase NapAB chaperone NapD
LRSSSALSFSCRNAPEGRFVVTVEDTAAGSAADTVVQLHRLDGVLSAAMVYQYSDTQEDAP